MPSLLSIRRFACRAFFALILGSIAIPSLNPAFRSLTANDFEVITLGWRN